MSMQILKTRPDDIASLSVSGGMEISPAVKRFQHIFDGYKVSSVLQAGFSSHLFDWLAKNGPADKSEISTALKLRGAHLGAFLQALEDLGCVKSTAAGYVLEPDAYDALVSDSPWCQEPVLEQLLESNSRWSRLADFMTEEAHELPRSPQSLWYGGSFRQHPMFEEVCQTLACLLLEPGIGAIRSVVCFDGCDGLASAMIKRRLPDVEVTAVVAENALQSARNIVEQLGVEQDVRILTGSPLDSPQSASSYDQAVLCHSLYPVRKTTAAALASVARWIAPGGGFFAAHWFCLEACATSPGGLHDLDKAIITDSHPLCHVEHFCERLEQAGLGDCRKEDMVGPYGMTKLHFAKKPL